MESLEAILPAETDASLKRMNQWPLEVRAIVSMLARPTPVENRRRLPRNPLRLEMALQFPDENGQVTDALLYTRDTSGMILGFITNNPPKPGQRATLKFESAQGVTRRMSCRVVRCRQVRDGWFEGTLDLTQRNGTGEGEGFWRKLRDLVGA
jgi:hypothetical protein